MQSLNEIKELIEEAASLRSVAEAYSDIAGSRLIAIRANIERNRQFVNELAAVFHVVKEAATRQKIKISKKNRTGTVNVVLTSNHRFYGGLEEALMDFFVAHSTISYGDSIVIGTTGEKYLRGIGFSAPYSGLIFKEDLPNPSELSLLESRLSRYEKVLVYHTKMQSVLVQRSVVAEIGGIADLSGPTIPANPYYIFEPEINKMLEFFDSEVAKILLEQAFFESELARTAARLVSMEQAQRNAIDSYNLQRKSLATVERNINNVRNLEIELAVLDREH